MGGGRINCGQVVDEGVMDDGVGRGNVEGTECGGISGGFDVAAWCGWIICCRRSDGWNSVHCGKGVIGVENSSRVFFDTGMDKREEIFQYFAGSLLRWLWYRLFLFSFREVVSHMMWIH